MPEPIHSLVAVFAENPRLVANILETHVCDARGRCAGCAGDERLRERWPCGPQGIAVRAQQLIDRVEELARLRRAS
jgi:hypothetical protein